MWLRIFSSAAALTHGQLRALVNYSVFNYHMIYLVSAPNDFSVRIRIDMSVKRGSQMGSCPPGSDLNHALSLIQRDDGDLARLMLNGGHTQKRG